MAEVWRIAVEPLERYGVPLISVKANSLFDMDIALATSEPRTTLAPRTADYLRFGGPPGPGRMIVPSDSGSLIARILRLSRLTVPTVSGGSLELGPCTVAIAHRPEAIGVAGLLGIDLLRRFARICYKAGPPAVLTLEA